MRIATWNVNSIRARINTVTEWLIRENVDVLAMQEIKCRPEQFPVEACERAGYHVEVHGLNHWNGVAFASKHEMTDVERSFPEMPGFGKHVPGQHVPLDAHGQPLEARSLGVTVGPFRLWNLYVPNGRSLNDPHMVYKMSWLAALRAATTGWLAEHPQLPLALMGDWNIAPRDTDMADPTFTVGQSTHVSPEERDMFASFGPLVEDVVRPIVPEGYTFWDYKGARFQKNQGMRIDFIMGSSAFADTVTGAEIHRFERQGERPSDHVPVVVTVDPSLLDAATDQEDHRPMAFQL